MLVFKCSIAATVRTTQSVGFKAPDSKYLNFRFHFNSLETQYHGITLLCITREKFARGRSYVSL